VLNSDRVRLELFQNGAVFSFAEGTDVSMSPLSTISALLFIDLLLLLLLLLMTSLLLLVLGKGRGKSPGEAASVLINHFNMFTTSKLATVLLSPLAPRGHNVLSPFSPIS